MSGPLATVGLGTVVQRLRVGAPLFASSFFAVNGWRLNEELVETVLGLAICSSMILGVVLLSVDRAVVVCQIGRRRRAQPFAPSLKTDGAVIEWARMGWAALICGPVMGLFMGVVSVVGQVVAPRAEPLRDGWNQPVALFLHVSVVGAFAGLAAAYGFWLWSAILASGRKAFKRVADGHDPDFDGIV